MQTFTPVQRAALTAIGRLECSDAMLVMFAPHWGYTEDLYWLCHPFKKRTLSILHNAGLIAVAGVRSPLRYGYSMHYVVLTDKGKDALSALRKKVTR